MDSFLRSRYRELLEASKELPLEERALAYDPSQCEAERKAGPFVIRLEPRRKMKQKKGTPDDSDKVRPAEETIVRPALDLERFNFTKIRDDERLLELELAGGRYAIVTNKYPSCRHHLLLVSEELRPQVLTRQDIEAIREFFQKSAFSGFFNSWSAAATVNHFHFQLLDESAPISDCPLEPAGERSGAPVFRVRDWKAVHLVFEAGADDALWEEVLRLQEANRPHNLFFDHSYSFFFPRNPDPKERGRELYGDEEPGGLEYAGIFVAYDQETFDGMSVESIEELYRRTTRDF